MRTLDNAKAYSRHNRDSFCIKEKERKEPKERKRKGFLKEKNIPFGDIKKEKLTESIYSIC